MVAATPTPSNGAYDASDHRRSDVLPRAPDCFAESVDTDFEHFLQLRGVPENRWPHSAFWGRRLVTSLL
jgi:hypothetical protein